MTAYLSFEWLKLSKRWMPRIIALLLMGLTVLIFWGSGTQARGRPDLFLPRAWLSALAFCSFFAPFFWPVLGGSWAGNEYSWGTIRTILTRRPQRIEHVLAALAVLTFGLALAIIAIMIAASLAGATVALLTGNSVFTSGVLTASFLGILIKGYLAAWYVSAFYLLVAYAAATVFRSAAVGIGIGIGSTLAQLIVSGIFTELGGIWNDIALQFPFNYTRTMISQVIDAGLTPGSRIGRDTLGMPSVEASLVAIAIYALIVLAITLTAVRTRDIAA